MNRQYNSLQVFKVVSSLEKLRKFYTADIDPILEF